MTGETTRKRRAARDRSVGVVFVGLVVLGLAAWGYYSHRKKTIERLYAEAAGFPPFYRGSDESRDAVRKLSRYTVSESEQMLLDLAVRPNPLAPEVPMDAINALSARKDPQVGLTLARLLQPHVGLEKRTAAARALQKLPCNNNCVALVLHYLERIWRGELNYEDAIIPPAAFADVKVKTKEQQSTLYESLYEVLRRHRKETLVTLAQVYGFGTEDPSPFALDLVTRLHMHKACGLLKESEKLINQDSAESYAGPRRELNSSISSLACN